MVEAVANMALETLRDLFIEEVKFLTGVEGQVVDVGRELQKMHLFLKDANKWQDRDKSAILHGWLSDLINLATRAEEVLEEYAVEVTSKGGAKNLKQRLKRFACILGECVALHGIGNKTAAIMSRMAKLTKDLESIRNGQGSSSSECNDDPRKTYGHVIDHHFVGMKNDIELLVSHVKNDDKSYSVISICGMGGLGKTTLARKIYQLKDFLFCFDALAWVCITQKLQAKAIFKDILSQLLPGENINEGEETDLVRKLHRVMIEKKCLVVLDDIWEINHWDILKNAFPLAESNSKILLTTRDQRVAARTAGFVHKLDFLTEDESWDLLQKIALPLHQSQGLNTANSKQFEAIGRDLVRRCGRLPLAVSVIGGILQGNGDLGYWNKVLLNMDSHIKDGEGVKANDNSLEHVLNLSYDALPYYLKFCFLYLGCFPEDKDIRVEDVYLIWMAEGLISLDDKEPNETLRDVAERYLNELASKCMVQVKMSETIPLSHWYKSCRLHDLVRDLCLSKGIKEKFFEVLDSKKQCGSSQRKIQRLAINLVDDNVCRTVAQCKNAKLRSLLLLSNEFSDFSNISWQTALKNALLRSLKVLVLENCTFKDKKFPDAVRKLVMLKHLSIKDSDVVELPEFVSKLPCLQSVDLRVAGVIRLPNSIDKMGKFRHLFLEATRINMSGGHSRIEMIDGEKLRLDCSTELETLIGFHSKTFDTNHLRKLTRLRRCVGFVYDIESLAVVVDHFTELKDQLLEASLEIYVRDMSSEQGSLVIDKLMRCPLNYLKLDGRLRRFPNWEPQLLQNVVVLILCRGEFREDPMETLQLLPTLRHLWLGCDSFAGTEMVCGSKGFPRLEQIVLDRLKNLEAWRVEEGAMPILRELEIKYCPKLKMLPEGLIFLASVTKLMISGMPSNFMERLRGEDYHKISHIPILDLVNHEENELFQIMSRGIDVDNIHVENILRGIIRAYLDRTII